MSKFSSSATSAISRFAIGSAALLAGVSTSAFAVGEAVKTGLNFDATIEQAKMSFETLLGSSQKAQQMVQQLVNFAAHTPFELTGVQNAAKQLLAMGFSGKQVIPVMTAVGNAVSAVGGGDEELQGVILALGQIQTKGKLSAEEMNQLAERGIPAWQILAQQMHKTPAELMKMASKGKLLSDQVIPALVNGLNQRFGGAMEKQSKTWNGMMSTLKDNFSQLLGTAMQPLFNYLESKMPTIINYINKLQQSFKSGQGAAMMKKLGAAIVSTLGWIADHGSGIVSILGGIASGFAAFKVITTIVNLFNILRTVTLAAASAFGILDVALDANPIGLLALAIAALVAAGIYLYLNWNKVVSFLKSLWQGFSSWAIALWNSFTSFLSSLWSGIVSIAMSIWGGIVSFFTGLWNGIKAAAVAIWNGIVAAVQFAIQLLYATTVGRVITMAQMVVNAFIWLYNHNYYFQALVDFIVNTWNTLKARAIAIWNGIKAFLASVWAGIKSVVSSAANGVSSFVSSVWNKIKSVSSSVWNSIKSVISSIWSAIRSVVSSVASSVGSVVSSAWNRVKSVTSSVWNSVKSLISSAIHSVLSTLSSLGSQAYQYAVNFMNMFISGIRSKISGIVSAAKDAAATLARILGFHSPAEEGPASDSDKWAPNFMNMFASGLLKSIPAVKSAVHAIANQMSILNGGEPFRISGAAVGTGAAGSTSGGFVVNKGGNTYNVTVNAGNADMNEKQLVRILQEVSWLHG